MAPSSTLTTDPWSSARSSSVTRVGRRASRKPTLRSRRRRAANVRTSAEERSSHCKSSTAITSGVRAARTRTAATKPNATAPAWAEPSTGSARRSAASSARRCGAGSAENSPDPTCSHRSINPVNGSRASLSLGRDTRTTAPWSRAALTPASQSVVLPIPASPTSTRPRTPPSSTASPRTDASSSSRPTIDTAEATTTSTTLTRPPGRLPARRCPRCSWHGVSQARVGRWDGSSGGYPRPNTLG